MSNATKRDVWETWRILGYLTGKAESRWEYKVFPALGQPPSTEQQMNAIDAEGWEIFAVGHGDYGQVYGFYGRRPKLPDA